MHLESTLALLGVGTWFDAHGRMDKWGHGVMIGDGWNSRRRLGRLRWIILGGF